MNFTLHTLAHKTRMKMTWLGRVLLAVVALASTPPPFANTQNSDLNTFSSSELKLTDYTATDLNLKKQGDIYSSEFTFDGTSYGKAIVVADGSTYFSPGNGATLSVGKTSTLSICNNYDRFAIDGLENGKKYELTVKFTSSTSGTITIEEYVEKAFITVNGNEVASGSSFRAEANAGIIVKYGFKNNSLKYAPYDDTEIDIAVGGSQVLELSTENAGSITIKEGGQYKADFDPESGKLTITREEIIPLVEKLVANGSGLPASLSLGAETTVIFEAKYDDGTNATLAPAQDVILADGVEFTLTKDGSGTVKSGVKGRYTLTPTYNSDGTVTVKAAYAEELEWVKLGIIVGNKGYRIVEMEKNSDGSFETDFLGENNYSFFLSTNIGDSRTTSSGQTFQSSRNNDTYAYPEPISSTVSLDKDFKFSLANLSENNWLQSTFLGWCHVTATPTADGKIELTISKGEENPERIKKFKIVVKSKNGEVTTTKEYPMSTYHKGGYDVSVDLKVNDEVYLAHDTEYISNDGKLGLFVGASSGDASTEGQGGARIHHWTYWRKTAQAFTADEAKPFVVTVPEGDYDTNIYGAGTYTFTYHYFYQGLDRNYGERRMVITKQQPEIIDPQAIAVITRDGETSETAFNYKVLRHQHQRLFSLKAGDKIYFKTAIGETYCPAEAADFADKTEGILDKIEEGAEPVMYTVTDDGDYRITIIRSQEDGSVKMSVEKMNFPEKLYVKLGDEGNYVVLHKSTSEDDDRPGRYASVANDEVSKTNGGDYYNAETGEITMNAGTTFIFSDNLADDQAKYGTPYGGVPLNVFKPGKNVRFYRQGQLDAENKAQAVTNYEVSKDDLYTDEHGKVKYNSHKMFVDLRYPLNQTFIWGDSALYHGEKYVLTPKQNSGNLPADFPTEAERTFIYHPRTGLYTLTMPTIANEWMIKTDMGEQFSFKGIPGNESITRLDEPYNLYCNVDEDGISTGKDTQNGFVINCPEYASRTEFFLGAPCYAYDNVTFVLDPSTNRLWVQIADKPYEDAEIEETPDDITLPVKIVFCEKRNDGELFKYIDHRDLLPTTRTGYYVSGPLSRDASSVTDDSGWIEFPKTNDVDVTPGADKQAETYDGTYYFFCERLYNTEGKEFEPGKGQEIDVMYTYRSSVHFGSPLTNEHVYRLADSKKEYEWPLYFENAYENESLEATGVKDAPIALKRIPTTAPAETTVPDKFVSEAGRKYFVEFDRSTTNVNMRLTRKAEDELFLVFNDADLSETPRSIKMEPCNITADGKTYWTPMGCDFYPTTKANGSGVEANSHFFFSGKVPAGADKRYIITRSTNWHADAAANDDMAFTNKVNADWTLTEARPMKRTPNASFLNAEATSTSAPSRVISADDSNLHGLNMYRTEPSDQSATGGEKYIYVAYVTKKGGQLPYSDKIAGEDMVQIARGRYELSGIEDAEIGSDESIESLVRVDGRHVSLADGNSFNVYDVTGRVLAIGVTEYEAQAAGIYLINDGTSTARVAIR